jgi:ribulose 1,5-bisphosphate synthetase/thiazole synthase
MAHDLSAKPLTPWRIMRWTGDDAMADDADVIVVGGGLAGLVAATEIADAGKRVIVVDQEGEQSLGGQAFWSFGGLFLVDTPRRTAGTYLPLPHPTHQQYSVNG